MESSVGGVGLGEAPYLGPVSTYEPSLFACSGQLLQPQDKKKQKYEILMGFLGIMLRDVEREPKSLYTNNVNSASQNTDPCPKP